MRSYFYIRKTLLTLSLVIGYLSPHAFACPDPLAWGRTTEYYTGADLYQPRYFSVVAGGDFELTEKCSYIFQRLRSDKGNGWFTSQPDFTIETPGMTGYDLHVAVISECDASLLINTPAGNWYYDDDDNGNYDPKIVLTSPSSGLLDIWVGTYDGKYCDAELRLETFR